MNMWHITKYRSSIWSGCWNRFQFLNCRCNWHLFTCGNPWVMYTAFMQWWKYMELKGTFHTGREGNRGAYSILLIYMPSCYKLLIWLHNVWGNLFLSDDQHPSFHRRTCKCQPFHHNLYPIKPLILPWNLSFSSSVLMLMWFI